MKDRYATKNMIGIGLGPSNLALAIALFEDNNVFNNFLFLEQSTNVSWHPGMMIEGTRLQVPYLKDLVTLRNPTSYFSFLNYIKSQNRLNEFINSGETSSTRLEYTMYLNWVKEHLPEEITQYGKRVTRVLPLKEFPSKITDLIVEYEDVNSKEIYLLQTRNLAIAVGGRPNIPDLYKPHIGDRVFHSYEFKNKVSKWPQNGPLRIGVIGSGQSAAEIINHTHDKFPEAEIYSIMRRHAFRPEDDSQFINEVFFPEHVDFMHKLDKEQKKYVLESYWNANYSAVNLGLIETLYSKMYQDKVIGKERVKILNYTEAYSIEVGQSLFLYLKSFMMEEMKSLELDFVILATGYDRSSLPSFLDDIKPFFSLNEGQLDVDRAYRVRTNEEFTPRIFVQGMSESIHGISHSLLSILPIRAGEIAMSLRQEQNIHSTRKEVSL